MLIELKQNLIQCTFITYWILVQTSRFLKCKMAFLDSLFYWRTSVSFTFDKIIALGCFWWVTKFNDKVLLNNALGFLWVIIEEEWVLVETQLCLFLIGQIYAWADFLKQCCDCFWLVKTVPRLFLIGLNIAWLFLIA